MPTSQGSRDNGNITRELRVGLRRGLSGLALCLAALLTPIVTSCASLERLEAVPLADTARASPLGIENARFFPVKQHAELFAEFEQAIQRQRHTLGIGPDAPLPTAHVLAISGGGDNGAFASGLLVGWTAAGDRPEFSVVTGVSTGALLAQFAFLGPAYDLQLRDVYTTIDAANIFSPRWLIDGFFNDAMSDTTPLAELISGYVDAPMMAAISREYGKGRLLLIGTTDLDAQRAVIWNIGAIAASGHPDALKLVRQILRASSAIPGMFQPVLIDVELDGKSYQELHVDGGAIQQMFLYPPSIDVRTLGPRKRRAYLIRNAREDPGWQYVERRTMSVAGQAISAMIHSSGSNDLMRIYFVTQRDGIDYNLAYIGGDFPATAAQEFDRAYMNALFNYAYQKARHGYSWEKIPPGLAESASHDDELLTSSDGPAPGGILQSLVW